MQSVASRCNKVVTQYSVQHLIQMRFVVALRAEDHVLCSSYFYSFIFSLKHFDMVMPTLLKLWL